MTLEPQFNVPFAREGKMTLETYQMLKSIYDALPENSNSIPLTSPDGSRFVVTVSNAGALVVSPA